MQTKKSKWRTKENSDRWCFARGIGPLSSTPSTVGWFPLPVPRAVYPLSILPLLGTQRRKSFFTFKINTWSKITRLNVYFIFIWSIGCIDCSKLPALENFMCLLRHTFTDSQWSKLMPNSEYTRRNRHKFLFRTNWQQYRAPRRSFENCHWLYRSPA